ncbi:MAG: hypothetical protein LBH25_04090, partial [Fibromonadaceae bacterium]|nr:hypothetical protein [Fibromonadaceae bacterium]
GTLFGIKRARGFLRNDSWVLRLDIKGFFMAIDREILFGLVMGGLRGTHCELLEFLIRRIVFNDPLKNARFKSPRTAWNNLPPDKSLINSAPNCGLPIGNYRLWLTLHPKKIKLQPAYKGFAFLGAYIYPSGIAAGRRIVKNFRKCVFEPSANSQKQKQRVQSYLGLMRHL